MIILVPMVLVALGLWQLLGSGDFAWSRYEYRMRSRGIVSLQRTPEWETNRKIGGVIAIVAGVVLFFVLLGSQPKSRSGFSPPEGNFSIDGTPVSREEARGMGLPVD